MKHQMSAIQREAAALAEYRQRKEAAALAEAIQSKATALAEVLQSKSVALPIYVRFQTASKMITVPVVSLSISDDELTVQYQEGQEVAARSFRRSDLTDIVAFCDANRKPVFLDADRTYFKEHGDDEMRQSLAIIARVQNSQHIYLSLNDILGVKRDRNGRGFANQSDAFEMRDAA